MVGADFNFKSLNSILFNPTNKPDKTPTKITKEKKFSNNGEKKLVIHKNLD